MSELIAQTRHFRGDLDAPITMIEFSDFQCPYCGRHTVETVPQLDEAYIEAGLVRLGYYPLAFLGEQSLWAAEAGECAADQDAFWSYHDFLFNRMAVEGQRDFTRENLKLFAEELQLDTEAFNACMDEQKYAQQIMNDTSSAQSLGVRSTPTFLIDGWAVVGAQPYEIFSATIDDLLTQQQQ
ncbi:MAG: DsbA family protein [Chloroflexaceae bacterium]|nr:DsbA family protein [Chloroflexaceae bacterium]